MSGEIAPVGALAAGHAELRGADFPVQEPADQPLPDAEKVDGPLPGDAPEVVQAQITFLEKAGVGYAVQIAFPENVMLEENPLHVLSWYLSANLGPLLGEAAVAWRAFRPTLVKQLADSEQPVVATAAATLVDANGKPI